MSAQSSAALSPEQQLLNFQEQVKKQLEEVQRSHQAQLDQMAKQIQSQQQELLQRQQRQADAAKMVKEMSKHVEGITLEALPALTMPGELMLPRQAQFFHLLHHWRATGASTPVSFGALEQHSALGKDGIHLVRAALGSQWAKWFAEEPKHDNYVPTQVLHLVLQSMERLQENWAQQENTAKETAASYAVLAREGKKRRALLLDADMENL